MSFMNCDVRVAVETDVESETRRIAAALFAAFPEAASEAELCAMAAPYFRNRNGENVEPRTIKYWLRGTTLPSYLHMKALYRMVGTDFFSLPRHGVLPSVRVP